MRETPKYPQNILNSTALNDQSEMSLVDFQPTVPPAEYSNPLENSLDWKRSKQAMQRLIRDGSVPVVPLEAALGAAGQTTPSYVQFHDFRQKSYNKSTREHKQYKPDQVSLSDKSLYVEPHLLL